MGNNHSETDDDLVVVTCFFDIGRSDFPTFSRTTSTYFDYFSFWARIRNRLIVFCHPRDSQRIEQIRASFGLDKSATTIIPIDDPFVFEGGIYKKMRDIEDQGSFSQLHFYPQNPENRADYAYITFLKFYFLAEAAKRVEHDATLAWLDFGFNHGGDYYLSPDDFDFLWSFNPKGKIHLFSFLNPCELTGIKSLLFMVPCFQAALMILPAQKAHTFFSLIKSCLLSLLCIDCFDDDQQLLLMAFRSNSALFDVHTCKKWHEGIDLCSSHHFSIRQDNQLAPVKPSLLKRAKAKLRSFFVRRKYDEFDLYGMRIAEAVREAYDDGRRNK